MLNRLDPEAVARHEAEQRATRAARLKALLRAERITRRLCRRSGAVDGFVWRAPPASARGETARLPTSFRAPPLPFYSFLHKGSGWCRVCGQKIYAGGSHLPSAGAEDRRTWHDACVTSYQIWTKPADYTAVLIHRQQETCAISGDRIQIYPCERYFPGGVDVDHEVPLFRVARDHAAEPWHELIRFWGLGNLRAVAHAAHLAKNAAEAKERKLWRTVGEDIMRLHQRTSK